jgi:hypothetical protein
MKISRFLLSIACVLLVCSLSLSQSKPSTANTPEKDRISITIATKQKEFKVGSPIILNIIVKNISEYKYCEHQRVETSEAELNEYYPIVKDASGRFLPRLVRSYPKGMRSAGLLCLVPGEISKESLFIDQLADVSSPGVYTVQIEHVDHGTNTPVHSNSITITISQ